MREKFSGEGGEFHILLLKIIQNERMERKTILFFRGGEVTGVKQKNVRKSSKFKKIKRKKLSN